MSETIQQSFKAVVIGGGPAGYVAAIRLGQLGVLTALVDEGGLGGTCLREGCIPSKALLGISKTVAHARSLVETGLTTGAIEAVPDALRTYKNGVVQRLTEGIGSLLKAGRVTVLPGRGRLAGRGRVAIEQAGQTTLIGAESVLLATGSSPIDLPLLPTDGIDVWSSSHALDLPCVPARLCVIGGGYIGLELATLYARLGSAVTVVELQDQLMPGTDRDLVLVVATSLKRMGVTILTDTRVVAVERVDQELRLGLQRRGRDEVVAADKVLVSIGRRPSSTDIGLDTVGLIPNPRGFLDIDDRMSTRVPGIFAAGDLAGPPLLAHKAHAEAEIAAEAMAGQASSLTARVIPGVAFTDPEVAFVGLTENAAKERMQPVLKGRFPFAALGRAVADDAAIGHVKVLIDPASHVLLGVGIAGHAAGEMIAEATLAIETQVTAETIGRVIHSHPTYSEAFQEACRAALGHAIHTRGP